MTAFAFAGFALLLVALIWAALRFDRMMDAVVLRAAGAINRKAGIVAASAFLVAMCGATLWSLF